MRREMFTNLFLSKTTIFIVVRCEILGATAKASILWKVVCSVKHEFYVNIR